MNDNTPAIEIRSLNKTFRIGMRRRRQQALHGLDLVVSPGEVFGFIGPNGAGKTTTIKILVGLLRPDSGEAKIFGRDVADHRSRTRVAYLAEMPDFYDYLTPAEFLRHCGALSGIPAPQVAAHIPGLLGRVGLDPKEKRQLRKFSKGMLQRIGIAQTLLADPDLFILDEPMSGLDPIGRRWVKDLILELGRIGKTVFFSSHVLAEAEAVCTRVAFLHRGRLVGQGSLSELLQTHTSVFEILVSGRAALEDQSLAKQVEALEPSGPDTLVVVARNQNPEAVLQGLIARGLRIQSYGQRHSTLEDVFLRALKVEAGEAGGRVP